MDITGVSSKRVRVQEELAPSRSAKAPEKRGARVPSSAEDAARVHDSRSDRGVERGRYHRPSKAPAGGDTGAPTPGSGASDGASAAPATQPAGSTAPAASVHDLATRYVDQYIQKSGHTLSDDEKAAKVSEIESFYSDSSRAGRLEKIVFS